MAQLYICPQGHRSQLQTNSPAAAPVLAVLCPVCGAKAQPSPAPAPTEMSADASAAGTGPQLRTLAFDVSGLEKS
ncbi:MAG: hypothetical protein K2R98_03640, partial [Gemmataceae bacterium]|nr:hypothetical protein [Gemmataceae bacterium]